MYGIVRYIFLENKTTKYVNHKIECQTALEFQEKKRYFFEKKFKKIPYKILGSLYFKYTGKTMPVEQHEKKYL